MDTVHDQMGFTINAAQAPQRIVSLVPSQTELLFDLGLESRIVGVTNFCIHPQVAKQKAIIGGTKNFRFDVIDALHPDLIIGNKEENYQEGIEVLRKKYPVWMSDIFDMEDALSMITSVGDITSTSGKAKAIVDSIRTEFDAIQKWQPLRSLYLIWRNPWMAAGTNTFIHVMMEKTGLVNAVESTRYPELQNDAIVKLAPELILLSSEPYPFREKHIEELRVLAPHAKIILVDGEMFSWYGSRLLKAPAYLNAMLYQLN
jgi:ABC-type hemin transport system substrate-binding protein